MFKRLIVFITGIALVIVGCKKPLEGWNKHVHDEDVLNAQNTINESLLSKHITTLASDEFEGRFPGTTGEDKTVEYLTETYKKLGLKPGNPDGTWLQKATMTGVLTDLKAQFITDDERWVLKDGIDIVGNSYQTTNQVNLLNADIVFCGYGVNAPE